LLGLVYLVFCEPTPRLLGAGLAVGLAGLAIRAYSAGCLEKNEKLATGGPYAHTRNPLYLGSFFMGVGFSIAGGRWILGIAFLVFFILVYWPVMIREQEFLKEKFADAYVQYALRVPLFFPLGKRSSEPGMRFRWSLYRKNREYEAALGLLVVALFLVGKMYWRHAL
jgi:protein-S-isoprenylcysteine O-methyltransferase Ste14